MRYLRFLLSTLLLSGLVACAAAPKGIQPVSPFDSQKYLGSWYEIARIENTFEKGLTRVTADYAQVEDGKIQVTNVGYSPQKDKWKKVVGKAYFVESDTVGHLKVSFQWPFYGSYIVFEVDKDYQHAYVAGSKKNYLWLLSRTSTVDPSVLQNFRNAAKLKGYDLNKLVIVDHTPLD